MDACSNVAVAQADAEETFEAWKMVDPDFFDKSSAKQAHQNHQLEAKLKTYSATCEATDLIFNVMQLKTTKAERGL